MKALKAKYEFRLVSCNTCHIPKSKIADADMAKFEENPKQFRNDFGQLFLPGLKGKHVDDRGAESTALKAAARELGSLARTVAIKRGARGSFTFSEGCGFHTPAIRARAVDRTGAGDSFNAGFLVRFLKGDSLEDCARAGAAAGARAVTKMGGTTAFDKSRHSA